MSPNGNVLNVDRILFERLFGVGINPAEHQDTPPPLVKSLQKALGYSFVPQSPLEDGRVPLQLLPLNGAAESASLTKNTIEILQWLLAIGIKRPTNEIEAETNRVRAEFINKMAGELAVDPEAIVFEKSRPQFKKEYETENKGRKAKKLNDAWEGYAKQLKAWSNLGPLTYQDILKANAPNWMSMAEGKIQARLKTDFVGNSVTARPVAPAAKAGVVTHAIYYMPASIADAVLQNAALQTCDNTEGGEAKKVIHWNDYFDLIGADESTAGYKISVVAQPDLRFDFLRDIAALEARIAVIEADKQKALGDETLTEPQRRSRVRKLTVDEGKITQAIKNKKAANGQELSLTQAEYESAQQAAVNNPIVPTIIITGPENAATDNSPSVSLPSLIRNVELLITTTAKNQRQYAERQTRYLADLERFENELPAKKAEYTRNFEAQKFKNDAERSRYEAENDPENFRPRKPRLDVLSPQAFLSKSKISRPTPIVATPSKAAPPQVRRPKAPQQPALAELLQHNIVFPVDSVTIFERMRGGHDAVLKALNSHFRCRLRKGSIGSGQLEKFCFFVPNDVGDERSGQIITALTSLKTKAISVGGVLTREHVVEILKPTATAAAASAAEEIVRRSAAVSADTSSLTTRSSEYICLVKGVSAAQLQMIAGHDRKYLKAIAKRFNFDQVNFIVTDANEILFSESALEKSTSSTSAVQLQIIFATLRDVVRRNEIIVDPVVDRAISQSFSAVSESRKGLFLTPVEAPNQNKHGVFDSIMLDLNRDDITHTPREIINFSERGKDICTLIKGGKGSVILNRIRDHVGLPNIQVGDNSIILISHQTGSRRAGAQHADGTAKLEEARNIIIQLANIIAERDYKRIPNVEAALQFVLGKTEQLPSREVVGGDSTKTQIIVRSGNRIQPQTDNQQIFLNLLNDPVSRSVLGVGPPGTGKTLMTLDWAIEQVFEKGAYERLVLVTPVRNDYGFLPGKLKDKTGPSYERLYQHIVTIFGKANAASAFEKETIIIRPPDNLLGLSLSKAVICCDEAEDMDVQAMRSLVTRPEATSKLVITGDLGQFNGDPIKTLRNARQIRVPNTTRITDTGMVEINTSGRRNSERWLPIGSYLDVGDFEVKDGHLLLKPLNGLAFAAINQTPSHFWGAMGFTVNDVQRGDQVRDAQILMDSARVPRVSEYDPSGMRGSFDPYAAIDAENAMRTAYMASRTAATAARQLQGATHG
jgi:phosphate starvation-inducible protein PhoH